MKFKNIGFTLKVLLSKEFLVLMIDSIWVWATCYSSRSKRVPWKYNVLQHTDSHLRHLSQKPLSVKTLQGLMANDPWKMSDARTSPVVACCFLLPAPSYGIEKVPFDIKTSKQRDLNSTCTVITIVWLCDMYILTTDINIQAIKQLICMFIEWAAVWECMLSTYMVSTSSRVGFQSI